MSRRIQYATLSGLVLALPALAHEQSGLVGGLTSGLLHPLTGLDHLVAMVAVGLWGAELGAPALWLLPILFPLVMAFGGVLGVAGVPLPAAEVFVAGSGVVLGFAVALRWNPGLWVASVLVALFAVFHGHAHGMELPRAANPLGYGAGFVMATGALHLAGIGIGVLAARPGWSLVYRVGGGLIALIGAYFLVRAFGVYA
jgi:urease accessory protein